MNPLEKTVHEGVRNKESQPTSKLRDILTSIIIPSALLSGFLVGAAYFLNWGYKERKESDLKRAQTEQIDMEARFLQKRDLNGNGIPEIFYEINGNKYFKEIDGTPIEHSLQR